MEKVINWQALAQAWVMPDRDLRLFTFVETAEGAVAAIDARPAV